jgi:hypothetical protein
MLIKLLEFGLLFFAIRKPWCEHHLWMIPVAVGALFRRWMNDAVLATQTARPKSAGAGRPKRAPLRLAVLALEGKHWRATRATSNRWVPGIRFRGRRSLGARITCEITRAQRRHAPMRVSNLFGLR